jgi:predicted N-acetyltransferase YhbS
MAETFTLDRVGEFSETDRAALRALTLAVYPPSDEEWAGRTIEWSAHDWSVRVHDDAGALVCYVGICLRQGAHEGRPVLIGGIGGVKTDPSLRRRGLAGQAMRQAAEFFHASNVGFGLLICEPRLYDYYGRLGWRRFGGELLVRQRGATVPFTFNRAMTLSVRSAPPETGTVDLLGAPW